MQLIPLLFCLGITKGDKWFQVQVFPKASRFKTFKTITANPPNTCISLPLSGCAYIDVYVDIAACHSSVGKRSGSRPPPPPAPGQPPPPQTGTPVVLLMTS